MHLKTSWYGVIAFLRLSSDCTSPWQLLRLSGGTVYRSIGYVAYQNRNSFRPGTAAYDYVWEIIHYVYGSEYDSEYKG